MWKAENAPSPCPVRLLYSANNNGDKSCSSKSVVNKLLSSSYTIKNNCFFCRVEALLTDSEEGRRIKLRNFRRCFRNSRIHCRFRTKRSALYEGRGWIVERWRHMMSGTTRLAKTNDDERWLFDWWMTIVDSIKHIIITGCCCCTLSTPVTSMCVLHCSACLYKYTRTSRGEGEHNNNWEREVQLKKEEEVFGGNTSIHSFIHPSIYSFFIHHPTNRFKQQQLSLPLSRSIDIGIDTKDLPFPFFLLCSSSRRSDCNTIIFFLRVEEQK